MLHGEKIAGSRAIINIVMKHSGSCPYWNSHREVQSRLLGKLLFDKWYKRPYSSYKLYWKLHPEELEKIRKYHVLCEARAEQIAYNELHKNDRINREIERWKELTYKNEYSDLLD